MNIGILGSSLVGQVVGKKLVELDHDVVLGTRTPDDLDTKRGMGTPLGEWLGSVDRQARVAALNEAAAHGDLLILATAGTGSLSALQQAGAENLNGKILIDISNPLDFSQGMPPTLTICNTDSLGEQIQGEFPEVKVVKTLNTVNTYVMIDPQQVAGGDHHLFLCGNDADAKARVRNLLTKWFGWKHFIDLGDISTARGTEMLLPLWVRLWGALGTPMFNFKIVQ